MFESYNPYNPYNPYYGYNQQPVQQISKQNPQMYKPQNLLTLQGKVVDSLDVVKATDIPYDGSVSYFPLTDNSAIITKQLQQDGTSKMVIYKPILENEKEKPKYITESEFKEQIKDISATSKDIKDLKDQIKDMNIKDIKEDIKVLKRKIEDITDDIKYKKEK
jgi:hypothetical protein